MAADIFHYGTNIGYDFTLLDIGGGFPGSKDSRELFSKVTAAINKGLEHHFTSNYTNLRIIAEPGQCENWFLM